MDIDASDIATALQWRARAAQRLRGQETGEQRLLRLARLQSAAFALLRTSPDGFEHFLRRNLASRRVKVIDGKWRAVSADRRFDEA